MRKFELCREINDFDTNFDFELFKAEHQDLESIKSYLERLQKWEASIANNIKHS